MVLKCRQTACSLDICLTNRCNMACRYCYYETLNIGKPAFLSFEQVKAGIESYMKGRDLSKIEKIAIAGGEPFLCFPIVDKTISFLRKKWSVNLRIGIRSKFIANRKHLESTLLVQVIKSTVNR